SSLSSYFENLNEKKEYVPILTYRRNILNDPESEYKDNDNDTTDTKGVQKRKCKQVLKLLPPPSNFELLIYRSLLLH
ncbi:156_t:CDS:1, partial [Gigaspora rosea]